MWSCFVEQLFKLHVESQVLVLPPDSLMCNPRKYILQGQKKTKMKSAKKGKSNHCNLPALCFCWGSHYISRDHSHINMGSLKQSWTGENPWALYVPFQKSCLSFFFSLCLLLGIYHHKKKSFFIKFSWSWSPPWALEMAQKGRRITKQCSLCVRGGMFTLCLFILGGEK